MKKKLTINLGDHTRVNFYEGDRKNETTSLLCAHCRISHRISPEMAEKYAQQAKEHNVSIDQIWECGKCWLAHFTFLTGEPSPPLKVECTHDVPPFSPNEGQYGTVQQ